MSKSGTRTPNGMGSIRKRPDGRYEARYTGADGKQHSVYGKTQKAVAEALRAATHSVDKGTWLEPSTVTVRQWLEEWQRDYLPHVTEATRTTYRRICDQYILPSIGPVRLSVLSPVHVRRMLGELQRRKGDAALKASTVRMAHRVLRAALGVAVKVRLLGVNPARDADLPRVERAEMHIIDRPAYPAFIAAANATRYPEALILMLQTGLRSGELRGLTWADWDEDASVLHVRRQLLPDYSLGPPKDGSVRDIVVGPEVAATLRAQRRRLAEYKLRAGDAWQETDFSAALIFRSTTGTPMSKTTLRNAVHRLADPLNLPGLHPHDLRHSYAVAALRAGADIKTVQSNLGHKNASMTLDVYAAYTTDAGKVAAEKLSKYFEAAFN